MATIDCPNCGMATRIRSSRAVVPTLKELHLQCTNLDCGATYGGRFEITHGISPSATPNLALQLRMAPPRRKQLPTPANDEDARIRYTGVSGPEVPPTAANDDDGCGEAVAVGS